MFVGLFLLRYKSHFKGNLRYLLPVVLTLLSQVDIEVIITSTSYF